MMFYEIRPERNQISIDFGFSRDIIDKLGEPYINKNNKGMGLGIFIAKNLIENVKGKIFFYNSMSGKAVVEIQFEETILIQ